MMRRRRWIQHGDDGPSSAPSAAVLGIDAATLEQPGALGTILDSRFRFPKVQVRPAIERWRVPRLGEKTIDGLLEVIPGRSRGPVGLVSGASGVCSVALAAWCGKNPLVLGIEVAPTSVTFPQNGDVIARVRWDRRGAKHIRHVGSVSGRAGWDFRCRAKEAVPTVRQQINGSHLPAVAAERLR